MTPQRDIRFASTEDGVSIAFWEIGSGQPVLISQPASLSHSELEWEVPSMASFYQSMADRYRVIRYDPRGFGLSGDPPGGWGAQTSAETQLGMTMEEVGFDIKAVIAASSVDSVVLLSVGVMGPVGILFTATHPELVTELVLVDTASDVATAAGASGIHTQRAIILLEKDLGERVPTLGFEQDIPADEIEAVTRLTKTTLDRVIYPPRHAQWDWNADSYLRDVTAPTLIICSRSHPIFAQDALRDARELTTGILNSRLRIVDGRNAPYFADQPQVLGAIDEFLQPDWEAARPSGFRTVVVTDIVDSTMFISEVGDEAARRAMRGVEERVFSLAVKHGGRVVKNLGDGSLVSFGSNTAALRFALEVQISDDTQALRLRVGMAAGEPIEEGEDIHGAVVAYASRVADLGGAGEVVVSDTVRQLAMGKGFQFKTMGQYELKGFDEPATVWKVEAGPV